MITIRPKSGTSHTLLHHHSELPGRTISAIRSENNDKKKTEKSIFELDLKF